MTTQTDTGSRDIQFQQLPRDVRVGDRTIRLRLLEAADNDALLTFGRSQPEQDLLFLERDITSESDIALWLIDTQAGRIRSVVASEGDAIMGYATIERGHLRWTRHVAEIRVMVDRQFRSHGLGHLLLGIAFERALEDDVAKIVAHMTPMQIGARKLFDGLGFVEDAVLSRHVAAADGELHDLVVMRFDTTQRLICEDCGQHALTLIPLQGRQLCWSCYEMEESELGAG